MHRGSPVRVPGSSSDDPAEGVQGDGGDEEAGQGQADVFEEAAGPFDVGRHRRRAVAQARPVLDPVPVAAETAEAHAESTGEGKGSTFTLELPRLKGVGADSRADSRLPTPDSRQAS